MQRQQPPHDTQMDAVCRSLAMTAGRRPGVPTLARPGMQAMRIGGNQGGGATGFTRAI
jgi:hypothetical protein